jgi:hypothetical protein
LIPGEDSCCPGPHPHGADHLKHGVLIRKPGEAGTFLRARADEPITSRKRI